MRSSSHVVACICVAIPFILTAAHAQNAGDRPADTWYTFDGNDAVKDAVATAEKALGGAGLAGRNFPNVWETSGTSDHVTVIFSCVPLGPRKSHILSSFESGNPCPRKGTLSTPFHYDYKIHPLQTIVAHPWHELCLTVH
jgi:hypothetical protein